MRLRDSAWGLGWRRRWWRFPHCGARAGWHLPWMRHAPQRMCAYGTVTSASPITTSARSRRITMPSWGSANVTTTAATSTTNAYGYTTAAQADAIVTAVNACSAALRTLGIVAAS